MTNDERENHIFVIRHSCFVISLRCQNMSLFRLIIASLLHHWRSNASVALGVAAAAAVLTGALLVGDSMRGSLRDLTLDRLGQVDEALSSDHFFRTALADELAAQPEFERHFRRAVPILQVRASVQFNADVANGVRLIGCDQRFWDLGTTNPGKAPGPRQIVLNRPLAVHLGVSIGDGVLLRLPRTGAIPAESPLGRTTETVQTRRVTVVDIVPAEGLGRFDLRASQRSPRNAFVSLDWLAETLDQSDKANTILVAGHDAKSPPPAEASTLLQGMLRPTPGDLGLRIESTPRGYIQITTDRLLFSPAAERSVVEALGDREVRPTLIYLANTIACHGREIPYSTVAALDFGDAPPWGPWQTPQGESIGPLADDRVVLNSWAADELGAKPGDTVRLTYFEPESSHGQPRERSVELTLEAVVELSGPAADPALTPKVAGVTDQVSMSDWDPPFPFDAQRIRPQDEKYWDDHKATPKAFVSLATGRRLWGSRFGATSSLQIRPSDNTTAERLRHELDVDPAGMGWVFQPVKRQGLAASAGTTPFDVLFLSFSFFIIAAAAMLVALLFRLGVEQRAAELGTLLALGLPRRRVARVLVGEGLAVAALGSLLGVPLGVGYAALMLLGLRTWWLAAVVEPFLRLHVTPVSLAVGFVSGLVIAQLAILWTIRRTRRMALRQLLAGQTEEVSLLIPGQGRLAAWTAGVMFLAAIGLALAASRMGQQAQAGAFFGAGAMVLIAGLCWQWSRLRSSAAGKAITAGRGNLWRVAARNAARNPGRSTLTIGLIASACFLIAAISAFHLDPTQQVPTLASGNGGFALIAETDQPVYGDQQWPSETRAMAIRVKPGDDASCLNLYQPRQPRILGLSPEFLDRGGFAWADSAESPTENPWTLLEEDLGTDTDGTPLAPAVLDMNTAMYSLHLYGGVGETYDVLDSQGKTVRLKIVGLLAGSIFQGDILLGPTAFRRHFPEVTGYRYFLVETPPEQTTELARSLEQALGDHGLVAQATGSRLADLLAVQNTYLSTFQSLGGLGLLLGTFGLAAVQLRNVVQRRGELALLAATGFRRARLAELVLLENALLLSAGLGYGLLAALVAVLPHWIRSAATIPWVWLGVTLALVFATGLLASLAAVRAAMAARPYATLRREQ